MDITEAPTIPSTHDPKVATLQEAYAAFGRGDIAAVLDVLTDDVDFAAEPASTNAPWYGHTEGKDGVAHFFEAIGGAMEITDFTPVAYASNDTDVMAVVRWSYTARATGKTVSMNLHHWWTFRDGKICRFRGAEDSEQSVDALR